MIARLACLLVLLAALPARASTAADVRALRAQYGAFHACYERQLTYAPPQGGKVTLQFVINRAGRVTTASASGVGDREFLGCLTRALRRMQFRARRVATLMHSAVLFRHSG